MKMRKLIILFTAILLLIGSNALSQTVSNVYLTGNFTVGSVLSGFYSTSGITDEDISLNWFSISPVTKIDSAANSYDLTNADLGKRIYLMVLVLDHANGDTLFADSSAISPEISANEAPVASGQVLLGDLFIGRNIYAVYNYSDLEYDTEDKTLTVFEWSSASDDSGTGETAIITNHTGSYLIDEGDAGRYFRARIVPYAQTGTTEGVPVFTDWYGPVNSIPYADNVSISGSATVDSTLTGDYDFHDADIADSEQGSHFQWYRDTIAIPFATSQTYLLTEDDVDLIISFEVTPVSSSVYPNTGIPVKVSLTQVITDPTSSLPLATDLCISGTRRVGAELTGKYTYENRYNEKNSVYRWYIADSVVKEGTSPDDMKYILTSADTAKRIRFAVIPRNKRSQVGNLTFSDPLAIFTMPRVSFSAGEGPQALYAEPPLPAGVFWGEGVSNNEFNPLSVNIDDSPFLVNYRVMVDKPTNSCQQDAIINLKVDPITMYFDSFRDIYCQNGGRDTIYVRNIPAGSVGHVFEMSNPNAVITQLNESTLIFDPGLMKAGDDKDFLRFRVLSGGIPIEIMRTFIIDSIAQVSIHNLKMDTVLCSNVTPFELYTSHSGGVFEGPVEDRMLDPSMALGATSVKFTYTTKRNCVSSVTVPVTINPAPVVAFALADSCIESSTDTTKFIDLTSSIDPISAYLWNFSEAGGSTTSTLKEPGYMYNTGNLHNVTLTVTTNKDCSSTKEATIDLGIKPEADFYWKSECFHPNESILLFDSTFSTSVILSRTWNFFDGDSLRTVKNPEYPKKKPGYLPVEYTVKTKYRNCHDVVYKEIFIRPTDTISADSYFEDFEAGHGGWVQDYELINSWTFGKPDSLPIKFAASGDSAWFTYLPANQKIESSSVVSPCFDFSESERPMIRLKIWKGFDRNRDGAVLQYKIGDIGTWQSVGTLNDGINWYNSTVIKGRPGGDQTGWTSLGSADTKWSESRHTLDELKGGKDVKLRIAYGSDGTTQDNYGMAFDDIWIGERKRNVLLEHFTNTSSISGSLATEMVNSISLANTEDVINIQYHTNFPGTDPFYNLNPADASARILFYGLARAPYSFIDGGTRKDSIYTINNFANIFDYIIADIDSNDVIRRSLINPRFDISIAATVSGGILSVNGQVKALENINSDNLSLYLAVTEKINDKYSGANGETIFYNVFRKFIPDAGGINLKKTWTKDESFALQEKTWIIERTLNSSDIEVVAFIQNRVTKELYQASSQVEKNIVVGIETPVQGMDPDFALYPNPARDKFTMTFKNPVTRATEIRIYDMSGMIVADFKIGSGITEYTVGNPGLKGGIYLVRVTSGGIDLGFRKLVISKF